MSTPHCALGAQSSHAIIDDHGQMQELPTEVTHSALNGDARVELGVCDFHAEFMRGRGWLVQALTDEQIRDMAS